MKKARKLSAVVLSSVIALMMGLSTTITVYAANGNGNGNKNNSTVQEPDAWLKYDHSFTEYSFGSTRNVVVVKQATYVLVFVDAKQSESETIVKNEMEKAVSTDGSLNATPQYIFNDTNAGVVYGGNPEIEFIGDPRNNYSYGVYNKPLADVANIYKSGINSKIGLEFNDMLNIVKDNRPVLVWTSTNLSKPYISKSWTYKDTGETIKWISGEHAVVVIGYNDSQIIVSDPYTGTIRYFDKELFKSRYNYLGKRALYY